MVGMEWDMGLKLIKISLIYANYKKREDGFLFANILLILYINDWAHYQ